VPRSAAARPASGEPATPTVRVADLLARHGLTKATSALSKHAIRVRVPVPMLIDPARATPVRVVVYATIESNQRRPRRDQAGQPCAWGMATIAEKRGLTRSPVERALTWLKREGWLETRQIGRGRTARRWVLAGIPFVEIQPWSLEAVGTTIDPVLFRLYGIYVHRRHLDRAGTVADRRADIAQLAGTTAEKLPALDRRLATAGMILSVRRPPAPTLIIPLVTETTTEQREHAADALTAAGRRLSTTPLQGEGATPRRSEGATPPRSEGAIGFSDLVSPRTLYLQPPNELPWCGTCISPNDRRLMDDDGFPSAPCLRCGVPAGNPAREAS
jgi:hypothetical protein